MKCPHCGVHYMDYEKECPVCGKRAGILAPRKTSKYSAPKQYNEDRPVPKPTKKSKSASSTARKQTYNNAQKSGSYDAAWQQASAGKHTHGNPLDKNKKSGPKPGCLIAIIVFISLILMNIGVISSLFAYIDEPGDIFDAVTQILDDDDYEDDFYESVSPSDYLCGAWQTAYASIILTIDDSDTVTWIDPNGEHVDEGPMCDRLMLTEENAEEWCVEDELERFPIDQYDHIILYAVDSEDSDTIIDWYLYIPKDSTLPTKIEYYDFERDAYDTLLLVSDDSEPAAGSAVMMQSK